MHTRPQATQFNFLFYTRTQTVDYAWVLLHPDSEVQNSIEAFRRASIGRISRSGRISQCAVWTTNQHVVIFHGSLADDRVDDVQRPILEAGWLVAPLSSTRITYFELGSFLELLRNIIHEEGAGLGNPILQPFATSRTVSLYPSAESTSTPRPDWSQDVIKSFEQKATLVEVPDSYPHSSIIQMFDDAVADEKSPSIYLGMESTFSPPASHAAVVSYNASQLDTFIIRRGSSSDQGNFSPKIDAESIAPTQFLIGADPARGADRSRKVQIPMNQESESKELPSTSTSRQRQWNYLSMTDIARDLNENLQLRSAGRNTFSPVAAILRAILPSESPEIQRLVREITIVVSTAGASMGVDYVIAWYNLLREIETGWTIQSPIMASEWRRRVVALADIGVVDSDKSLVTWANDLWDLSTRLVKSMDENERWLI